MPYARVGGIDLYYEAHGTGPRVVVLAHGALGSIDFAETFGLKASTLAARAAIVPALRGFLAEPLDTARLPAIAAPTLVLTQPGDALHPLRSGEVLNRLMPAAALCVAPSTQFWRDRPEDMADQITAFIEGRDGGAWHSSTSP